MRVHPRFGLSVGAATVLLLGAVLAPVTALAQFKPAGNYTNTGMTATVFYSDSSNSVFFFAQRQITAGASGTTDTTSGFFSISLNFGSVVLNCSVSNNFAVASDVSSAAFHEIIPAGSADCGGSTTSDTQVDITWAGAGPIQSTATSRRLMCSGYTDESQGTDSNNAGPTTVTVTPSDGTPPVTITADAQTFHFSRSIEHAQGAVPPESCNAGVGRGAGRATPAAGTYSNTLQEASTFDFSNGSFLELVLDRRTTMSNPLSGGLTTGSQTVLTISGPADVGGCFVIDSGDFTFARDASSASLSTTVFPDTQSCSGGSNVAPDGGATITATWTGTAPVATTRADSQFACNNYHFQTNSTQIVSGVADVTVTIEGVTTTLTGSSEIGSIDTGTHADGTPAAGCFFRG